MFDFSILKRDPNLGREIMNKTNGSQIIAKESCQVIIPSRYFEVGLGNFSDNVEALGVFALVSGTRYCVS